ncbi:MAG: hypothetical protein LCH31_09750 [Actinobacteria bacterium]|nr:hypothetical protein [Actinomycetota bacterium]
MNGFAAAAAALLLLSGAVLALARRRAQSQSRLRGPRRADKFSGRRCA